jgi:PAS domain S-box-containing protein
METDGSILYANQALHAIAGVDRGAFSQARLQTFLSRGAAIFYETQFVPSLIVRGSLHEIALDFVRPGGERVPTLVSAILHTDELPPASYIMLSIFEAKQRSLYEAELIRARREAEEISSIVRRSSDAILRVTADDIIESWNRGAEQTFGYSAETAIGESIFSLISQGSRDSFKSTVEQMKLGEEVVLETTGCRNTGELVDVSVSLNPVLEVPGILIGYSAIFRNVTDRKIAEKALLQAEKLASVGRLASSISHEINNPLAAVTNLLYILGTKDLGAEAKSLVRTAQDELARVSQITAHTLRFHKQSSDRTEVNLHALFDSILGLYRTRFQNTGIVAINDAPDTASLTCFEGELRQILFNLVANSFDALRGGGTLRLRARYISLQHGAVRGVKITVADNGGGMNGAVMERLFEPFFSTKGIGGTGLGLWIARDLVRKNHGSIKIRSKADGEQTGTVASLQFPIIP